MLTRGNSVFTPVFFSRLAPVFSRYVNLKRALGRRLDFSARTLHSLDQFLHDHSAKYPDLNAAAFQAWCHTHEHVSSGVRRARMRAVFSFCLYRRRSEPQCFVPDPSLFPAYHQTIEPYIFSEGEVAKLLRAASSLKRHSLSPVRPEAIRPRGCSVVHHRNPPWRVAGSKDRRLRPAGINITYSSDEVL